MLDLGTAVGLNAQDIRNVLESGLVSGGVLADERRAALSVVSGMLFIALDKEYGISGA